MDKKDALQNTFLYVSQKKKVLVIGLMSVGYSFYKGYVRIFVEERAHKVFAVVFCWKYNCSPSCLTKCFLLEFFNFIHTIRERGMIRLEICLKESKWCFCLFFLCDWTVIVRNVALSLFLFGLSSSVCVQSSEDEDLKLHLVSTMTLAQIKIMTQWFL